MKMKFKDLYIGQEFTHQLLPMKMMKVENERYRQAYTPEELSAGSVPRSLDSTKAPIDPSVQLSETWVNV